MNKSTFFQVLFAFLVVSSTVQGSIGLTVNGEDPSVAPLELKTVESLKIQLFDSESAQTSYDLTLSATGGVFLFEDLNPSASSELVRQEKVTIQTSDLEKNGPLSFEFGGVLGDVAPPFGGIPGGVAGGELTTFFYEFFFSWFGGWPSLNE